MAKTKSKAATLLDIAKKHLFVETLETRNSDSLDFHDVCAASIKSALEDAYLAGQESKPETTVTLYEGDMREQTLPISKVKVPHLIAVCDALESVVLKKANPDGTTNTIDHGTWKRWREQLLKTWDVAKDLKNHIQKGR